MGPQPGRGAKATELGGCEEAGHLVEGEPEKLGGLDHHNTPPARTGGAGQGAVRLGPSAAMFVVTQGLGVHPGRGCECAGPQPADCALPMATRTRAAKASRTSV